MRSRIAAFLSVMQTQSKSSAALAVASAAFSAGWRPEPRLSLDEWADKKRVLSSGAAEPGRWRTHRTPYLREPMQKLSSFDPVQEVIVMKGTQLGFTEMGCNWIGYCMEHAPGPMLVIQTSIELVKRFSSQRLDRMIEDTPALSCLISGRMARDQKNTMLLKEFPGGLLAMAGSKSSSALRSMSVRYLMLDEIDTYEGDVSGEGDPVSVAEERTASFPTRRKILKISSPKIKGASRIESEFEKTDQRYFFVACIHCHHRFVIVWDLIRWDKDDPSTTRLVCPECDGAMYERHKPRLLASGEWRPTAESESPTKVGYHISGLYSPWRTWELRARQFLAAKDDPSKLKPWVNSCLGEPWQERGDAPEWQRVYERREGGWQLGQVPEGALVLTAGVDVQRDRLEAAVWGWGRGHESWLVDYLIFEGSPEKTSTFDNITSLLSRRFPTSDGRALRVDMLAIDTGDGLYSQHVYSWARSQDQMRVMAIKGSSHESGGHPLSASNIDVKHGRKTISRGLRLWSVATGIFKSETYGWLRLMPPVDGETEFPPGYVHLPLGLPSEFCKQLCSESLTTKVDRGRTKMVWNVVGRNEALDTRVYARAALYALGADTAPAKFWARAAGSPAVAQADPEHRRLVRPPAPATEAPPRNNWMRGFGHRR